MTRATVNVHEAKTDLSRLMARVEAGEEIDVARRGKVIATLIPARGRTPRLGTMPEIRIGADYDDPLPRDLAETLGAPVGTTRRN